MMLSIIYLIFGLSLTSMCVNVIQVKLSDSFRHASAKIGATIGLSLAEEEARSSQNLTPVPENASIHSYGAKPEKDDHNGFGIDSGTYDNAEVRDGKIVSVPTIQTAQDPVKPMQRPSVKREAPPRPDQIDNK